MLIKEFLLHLYGRRIGVLAAIVFSSVIVSGCGAANLENCEPNETGGGCTITDGSHAGFEIGMTKAAAFDNACKRSKIRLIHHDGIVLYTNGKPTAHSNTSICELEEETLAADHWRMVEDRWLREREIRLYFSQTGIERIQLKFIGLDF